MDGSAAGLLTEQQRSSTYRGGDKGEVGEGGAESCLSPLRFPSPSQVSLSCSYIHKTQPDLSEGWIDSSAQEDRRPGGSGG